MGYHLWLFQIQYSAAFWSLVSVFISLSDVLDLVCSNAFGSISGELWRSWVKWSSRQKMASASSGGAMRSHAEPDHLITVEWSCESFPGIFQAGYGSITIHTIFRGWTSIYQLFWCSPGVQGFDTLPAHASKDLGFVGVQNPSNRRTWFLSRGW